MPFDDKTNTLLVPNHQEYARGNCTMPNRCTCFCKSSYNKRLCDIYGGDYCKTPFQDPLVLHRNILKPDELFGTRDCWSGYEGLVDDQDFYRSCHMTIYEPSYIIRHTISLITWGTILSLVGLVSYLCFKRRAHKRKIKAKIEQRKSQRPPVNPTVRRGSNAFTFRSSSQTGGVTTRSSATNAFTHRSMTQTEKGDLKVS